MGKRGPRDIEYLTRRQRAVIRFHVQGMPVQRIADIMGYSRTWVSELINSPAGKDYGNALFDDGFEFTVNRVSPDLCRGGNGTPEAIPCPQCAWHAI